MCPVTPSSKPNFENKRNEAARRSLRCRRSSSTVANLGGPGKLGFFTGAVAMLTSKTQQRNLRAEYSTEPNGSRGDATAQAVRAHEFGLWHGPLEQAVRRSFVRRATSHSGPLDRPA